MDLLSREIENINMVINLSKQWLVSGHVHIEGDALQRVISDDLIIVFRVGKKDQWSSLTSK